MSRYFYDSDHFPTKTCMFELVPSLLASVNNVNDHCPQMINLG